METRKIRKETLELQRYMLRQGLEPIQSMVGAGALSPHEALSIVSSAFKTFSSDGWTSGYKKFMTNCKLIYLHEPFSPLSYILDSGDTYHYRRPSENDTHTLYKIYQYASGTEFKTPEELKAVLETALTGKHILEIGCGAGFNLKVLKDLGAEVSGIEPRSDMAKTLPELDIRIGDARHLNDIFEGKQFDIIYSRDLFCTAIMDSAEAMEIAPQLGEQTNEGGLNLHQVTYARMEIPLYLLGLWLSNREVGRDHEGMEERFWNLSDAQREDRLYTNRCILDPQDLVRRGLKIQEYTIENGELNIIARK